MPANVMLALETQARAELMTAPDGGLEPRADPAHVAELVQHVLVGSNRFALQAASEYVVYCRSVDVLYEYIQYCTYTVLGIIHIWSLSFSTVLIVSYTVSRCTTLYCFRHTCLSE